MPSTRFLQTGCKHIIDISQISETIYWRACNRRSTLKANRPTIGLEAAGLLGIIYVTKQPLQDSDSGRDRPVIIERVAEELSAWEISDELALYFAARLVEMITSEGFDNFSEQTVR